MLQVEGTAQPQAHYRAHECFVIVQRMMSSLYLKMILMHGYGSWRPCSKHNVGQRSIICVTAVKGQFQMILVLTNQHYQYRKFESLSI